MMIEDPWSGDINYDEYGIVNDDKRIAFNRENNAASHIMHFIHPGSFEAQRMNE